MIFKIITALLFVLVLNNAVGQPFATWDAHSLILDNGISRRVLQFGDSQKGFVSNSLKLKGNEQEFLDAGSEEFYFELDGKKITGTDTWEIVSVSGVSDETQGNGAKVILKHPGTNLQIAITYLMYSELPIIRKKISFTNTGSSKMKLESLDIERLRFKGSDIGNDCWIMHARKRSGNSSAVHSTLWL